MQKNVAASALEFFGPLVLNETVSISLKHRYIYFEVPKAGSSSVMTALHELELRDLPDPFEIDPHPPSVSSPLVKPYQLSSDHFSALLGDPDYFKFSFVRNPYPRVLSAYLDKIQSPYEDIASYYRGHFGLPADAEITFEQFLERVAGQLPKEMNKHWRPMVFQSFREFCDLDFVGTVEDFAIDFAYVAQRIGTELGPIRHVAPHATGALGKLQANYTPETISLMQSVYAADFAAFGYEPEPGFMVAGRQSSSSR